MGNTFSLSDLCGCGSDCAGCCVCCPSAPSTLYASCQFVGSPCVGTQVFTLTWSGSSWTGSAAVGTCGTTLDLTLSCAADVWTLATANCSVSSTSPGTLVSCNPFEVTFQVLAPVKFDCAGGLLAGPINVDITE